jgi:protein-S-isoprenylcysteine O-methyltransferase Ste14
MKTEKNLRWWSQREFSSQSRLGALAVEGFFFVILLPTGMRRAGDRLDRRLKLPRFCLPAIGKVLSLLLAAGGLIFALWSIRDQFERGRGTPVPAMPTQELITDGPYAHSRNPMALGTLLLYLGMGLWSGSISMIALVLAFFGLLLVYIKRVEEREMEARFGDAYRAYRRETPFLLPRLGRRAVSNERSIGDALS